MYTSSGTDKDRYNHLLGLAKEYLTDAQVSLMKFSLGLRAYSPKIEMFHQIAVVAGVPSHDCQAVVQINGKLTCNPDEINSLLKEDIK